MLPLGSHWWSVFRIERVLELIRRIANEEPSVGVGSSSPWTELLWDILWCQSDVYATKYTRCPALPRSPRKARSRCILKR